MLMVSQGTGGTNISVARRVKGGMLDGARDLTVRWLDIVSYCWSGRSARCCGGGG